MLADASLQAGVRYKTTVRPRVRRLNEAWPDAETTSGLVERIRRADVAAVLEWKPKSKKMNTLCDLANFSVGERVEASLIFGNPLDNEAFCERLKAVKGVGPKNLDYLALTGAAERGWSPAALDAAIWAYQTGEKESSRTARG